jgi:hypothetical protein
MLYYVDTNGCVNMFSNSKQEAIARKRAIPQPSKREKCVVSLEEAKRIIDEWIKEHS